MGPKGGGRAPPWGRVRSAAGSGEALLGRPAALLPWKLSCPPRGRARRRVSRQRRFVCGDSSASHAIPTPGETPPSRPFHGHAARSGRPCRADDAPGHNSPRATALVQNASASQGARVARTRVGHPRRTLSPDIPDDHTTAHEPTPTAPLAAPHAAPRRHRPDRRRTHGRGAEHHRRGAQSALGREAARRPRTRRRRGRVPDRTHPRCASRTNARRRAPTFDDRLAVGGAPRGVRGRQRDRSRTAARPPPRRSPVAAQHAPTCAGAPAGGCTVPPSVADDASPHVALLRKH